ncbi:uncharacterized protein [Rutidosis leptorrhynchoides]|uniref:uncharacterized protein isoform X8 n=1 Tax=Rutidosis leptorrhynchoides TaxID=125765 RepID=UPI003A9974B3
MGSYTKDSNFVYDLTDGKRIEHTIKKQKDKFLQGRIKIKIQAKLLSINLVLSLFRKRKVLTKWFLVWLKGLRRWLDSLKMEVDAFKVNILIVPLEILRKMKKL